MLVFGRPLCNRTKDIPEIYFLGFNPITAEKQDFTSFATGSAMGGGGAMANYHSFITVRNKVKPDLPKEDFHVGRLMPSWEGWVESTRRIFGVPRRRPYKVLDPGSVPFRRKCCCNLLANTLLSA